MELAKLIKELETRISQRKLYNYKPYGHPDTLCPDGALWKEKQLEGWATWSNKPWQWDFHKAGYDNQERMLICANRVGKSEANFAEVAMHMTGDYPDWWEGKVFKKPVLVWTGSPTNETSRDIAQKMLLGGTDKENLGTGWIPRDKIIDKPRMRQAGVSDVVDSFKVRHKTGGVSICILKTYEQGWRKWQGTQPDVVALDEEPEDFTIYTEALTRILTSHGIMMITFTPLLGQTELVLHFQKGLKGQFVETATWEDAPHLNREERERMAASYPDYEVQARTMGVPMMGEGRIFSISEDDIKCQPFEIPTYYSRICGIDFGLDHPAAGAWLAYDRDRDIIYVYDCYKKSNEQPLYHAEAIKRRGKWPVAWPHDGANREKGATKAGTTLASTYRQHGVNMLSRSARYKNEVGGAQPQWPVIEEIQERMKTGRFKVFSNLYEWFDEFRSYHTKDGKIVAKRDDILKATFYAVMMRRFASTNSAFQQKPQATIFSMRR